MEPLITTDFLVCVRKYEADMVLKENDIITFYAERFGEKIIITYRFPVLKSMRKDSCLNSSQK